MSVNSGRNGFMKSTPGPLRDVQVQQEADGDEPSEVVPRNDGEVQFLVSQQAVKMSL
jgi:hypothetical protein